MLVAQIGAPNTYMVVTTLLRGHLLGTPQKRRTVQSDPEGDLSA